MRDCLRLTCLQKLSALQARLLYSFVSAFCFTTLVLSLQSVDWLLLVLFILSISLYSICCWREPGYLGYADVPDSMIENCISFIMKELEQRLATREIELKTISQSNLLSKEETRLDIPDLNRNHWEFYAKERFCHFCQFKQPIRTKHCYVCHQCVARFDHHCPFTGMCVGQNNHFLFWIWLLSQSCLMLYALYLSFFILIDQQSIRNDFTWKLIMALNILTILLLIGFGSVVVSVCVYQTFLIMTCQLTFESVKNIDKLETWPWYFRSLKEQRPELDMKSPLFPFSNCSKFLYPLLNIKSFFQIFKKSLGIRNRRLLRFNLTNDVVKDAFMQEMIQKSANMDVENVREKWQKWTKIWEEKYSEQDGIVFEIPHELPEKWR